MRFRFRFRATLATLALGTVALLGLTACGTTAATDSLLSPEASVLNAMGFSTTDLAPIEDSGATSDPDATAGPGAGKAKPDRAGRADHLRRQRVLMRKNTLHGEIVVKTRDGNRTIDVQRGSVTAVTATSVTVKSSDGFTLTWTVTDKTRVAQHRTKVAFSSVKVGQEVGLAGAKSGDTTTARLLVIAN